METDKEQKIFVEAYLYELEKRQDTDCSVFLVNTDNESESTKISLLFILVLFYCAFQFVWI